MRGFRDNLKRRNHDVSAGNVFCRFRVAFEILALLKDLDDPIIGCRSEMVVGLVVPDFHAAI